MSVSLSFVTSLFACPKNYFLTFRRNNLFVNNEIIESNYNNNNNIDCTNIIPILNSLGNDLTTKGCLQHDMINILDFYAKKITKIL